MVNGELPRGTVTMLFTDIEGSTRMLQRLGSAYLDVLADHHRLLRAAFGAYGGHEIGTQGDAFFVAFARAGDAVAAAVEAQQALARHSWPEGEQVRVRMGMHTGEPLVGVEGYQGLGVHRAARICSAGHGGQILLSNATRELIHDDLAAGIELLDLGERRLKDIERPERLAQVVYPGMPASFPPLKTAAETPFEGREEELADELANRFGWVRSRRRQAALVATVLIAGALGLVLVLRGGDRDAVLEALPNSLAVLSPDGRQLRAAVVTGTAPGGVAIGEGSVWVSNTGEATVSRVDLEDHEVIQTVSVGTGPTGIAVSGGFVWVANSLDGTVSQIDPRKAGGVELRRIRVGNEPNAVAAADGVVWVANATDHTLSRIDAGTGRVRAATPAGTGADAVAVADGGVWVASFSGATVTEVDAGTGRVVRSISVGHGPSGVAVGGGAVWVVNSLDGTLSKVDPERSSVVATVPVGRDPHAVAVRGDTVWVADEAGFLTRVDARRATVVERLRIGSRPAAIAAGARETYVALRGSGPAHRGGTLRVVAQGALPSESPESSLDPSFAYAGDSYAVVNLLADGLVTFRRTAGTQGGLIVPDLATSVPVPTEGGRRWTFRVRQGIRYSNGEPLLAGDIRRGIERGFASPDTPAQGFFGGLEGAARCRPGRPCDLSRGIETDDDRGTITFRLTEPDPDFLYKLALPIASAVPRSAPAGDARRGVPGTGPYRVARSTDRDLLLVRNRYFRERSAGAQPLALPDRIEIRFGLSPSQQLRAVERGDADLTALDTQAVAPGKLARLQRLRASQVHLNPTRATEFAFLSARRSPFDDVRARRAANLALDRSALRRTGALSSCQVLPPAVLGYSRYCPYRRDLARARRLVAASGARGARVRLAVPPVARAKALMEVVARGLRAAGFRVRSDVAPDFGAHFAALTSPATHAGFVTWVPDYASPANILPPVLGCRQSSNFSGFCDRGLDERMRRAARQQTLDPAAAARLWQDVDHEAVDRAALIPLTTNTSVTFVGRRVGNVQHHPQWGVLMDQLWVR